MAAKRLEYIDALRGFTMFLVVFQHIMRNGGAADGTEYIGTYQTVLGNLFVAFRMPLFFFISGFIAYKSLDAWDFKFYKNRLWTKAQIQLIPAVIFFIIFAVVKDEDPFSFLTQGFGGYWFTPVLFEMFVIYFTCSFLFRSHPSIVNSLLVFFAIIGVLFLMLRPEALFHSSAGRVLCLENLCKYFQYFVLGYFVRRYSDRAFRVVSNDWMNFAAIAIYAVSMILIICCNIIETQPMVGSILRHIVVRYAGLFMVFAFFFKHREYFAANGGGRVSTVMQYVGRRTLDIYLLHYFFLPTHLPFIDSIVNCGNVAVQIAVISLMTMLIIGLCLLVSEVLRNSNFIAHYLFGAKREKSL